MKQTTNRYRLSVHRSNRYITAQIIDDATQKTLVSVTSKQTKESNKKEQAKEAARVLAKSAAAKKISRVYLDRRNYRYHGRVKIFADTLRENGLEF